MSYDACIVANHVDLQPESCKGALQNTKKETHAMRKLLHAAA